jgi:phospholipid/cholesterol/gamma-HCH transport system substrate-binding protein
MHFRFSGFALCVLTFNQRHYPSFASHQDFRMPSERTRNLIVGATVLVAIGGLMWGVLILGKFPSWGGPRPYTVTLLSPNANGAGPGSKVDLNGVNVGQVSSVSLVPDPDGKLIAHIVVQIDGSTNIPADAVAVLGRPTAGIGSAFVSIVAVTLKPPLLPKNGSATLPAQPDANGLIPNVVIEDINTLQKNMSVLSGELTVVAKDLHGLLAYAPPDALTNTTNPASTQPLENVSTVIIRLNRTVASIQNLLGDPALQQNVRTIVQNLADASSQLKTTLQNINTVVASANTTVGSFNTAATQASATLQSTQIQIVKISERLVTLLDQLDKTTTALTQGNGTTGKLINDPRLYEGLVDLSTSLKNTVNDLDFLVKKWKDEGLPLHLK